MRLRKLLSIAGAVIAATTVLAFGPASPASATTWTAYAYPSPGYVYGKGLYKVDNTAGTLEMALTTYDTLPAGQCVTLYVDISRTPNVPSGHGSHYDIRAIRNCQAGSYRSSGVQYEESTYGIEITGVQKVAMCVGPINQMGNCNQLIDNIEGTDPVFDSNATCSRSWTRNSSGTNFYWSGGDPRHCDY